MTGFKDILEKRSSSHGQRFPPPFIALLVIVAGIGLSDSILHWLEWFVSDSQLNIVFVCLALIGLSLERMLSPHHLAHVFRFGLAIITLLLGWSLIESWNHIFLQPDSRSYIRNDGYRAPLYPWFIDLLTFGHDLRAPNSFYHGPIGQLIIDGQNSPLVWPIRVQKVILYASLLTILWVMARLTSPVMALLAGFVILFADFLSEERHQLLTEPLTQALVIFSVSAYCQFILNKKSKYLFLIGILFGLSFLLRPAVGYVILLPVAAGVHYIYQHRFQLVFAIRPLLFGIALPIMISAGIQTGYQYVKNGIWAPSPVWAEKKITWALQVAGVDDIGGLTDPLQKEFLQRSLELKWKEDWGERRYLKDAHPHRNWSSRTERGHEFMVRNIHLIASPIASAMAEERGLEARAEIGFKHNLMLAVAATIFDNREHRKRRWILFAESFRDVIVWQHRIQARWLNGMDIVGLTTLMLLLGLFARQSVSWIGLLCMSLHGCAIVLFCYTNVPTERFTHASEILYVLGVFLVLTGFLRQFVGPDGATTPYFRRPQFRKMIPLTALVIAIGLPQIANVAVFEKWMPDRAYLHGVPIELNLAIRQLGKQKSYQISMALRDDPQIGRELLRKSGLFSNQEECELLALGKDYCEKIMESN